MLATDFKFLYPARRRGSVFFKQFSQPFQSKHRCESVGCSAATRQAKMIYFKVPPPWTLFPLPEETLQGFSFVFQPNPVRPEASVSLEALRDSAAGCELLHPASETVCL